MGRVHGRAGKRGLSPCTATLHINLTCLSSSLGCRVCLGARRELQGQSSTLLHLLPCRSLRRGTSSPCMQFLPYPPLQELCTPHCWALAIPWEGKSPARDRGA